MCMKKKHIKEDNNLQKFQRLDILTFAFYLKRFQFHTHKKKKHNLN